MNWSSPQIVAWTLVLSVFAFGCDSSSSTDKSDPCLTALRINLEVADGTVIDEVEYVISGNGMEPMGGTIDTSAPGATASVESFGIPPGEGYIVTMVASSVDGSLMCGGSASFDVGPGVSTEVEVMLHCKGSQQFGGVRVNGKLNICAELEKVIVAPLQTASGYALEVSANASDEEGDPVDYSWTATGGSFGDASAAATVFTCGEASEEQITIEVSDDAFEYCADSWTIDVNCVDDVGTGGTGGDGGGGGTAGSGGTGGSAGSGGTAGSGGSGGTAGSGGTGGSAGSGGTGGSAGSGGTGGSAGSGGGTAGNGGGAPPECTVSVSVD
ncbi:MAG TPA: hypothetical protein VFG22_16320 [Polyangiales bacterium]|nr:hypothetical protein [Polyangiales bacterium]